MTRVRRIQPEELKQMWADGVPAWKIANHFKVTVPAIHHAAARHSLPARVIDRRNICAIDHARLRALWEAGVPQAQIAAEFGLSPSRISVIAKEKGLPSRKKGQIDISRAWIVDGLAAGHNVVTLAERARCSENTLRRAMERFGIPAPTAKTITRPTAEPQKPVKPEPAPVTLVGRLIASRGRWSELETIRQAQGWTTAQVQQRYHQAVRAGA